MVTRTIPGVRLVVAMAIVAIVVGPTAAFDRAEVLTPRGEAVQCGYLFPREVAKDVKRLRVTLEFQRVE